MEREDSSCCDSVGEGGRGRADGRLVGAVLGENRVRYALAENAREFTQN